MTPPITSRLQRHTPQVSRLRPLLVALTAVGALAVAGCDDGGGGEADGGDVLGDMLDGDAGLDGGLDGSVDMTGDAGADTAVDSQDVGDVCGDPGACTEPGTQCDGDTLEICEIDENGCLVENAQNCAAAAGGFCDDTQDPHACAVDPCFGLELCDVQQTTCEGDTLVECAPDANGCLVETRRDCAAVTDGACDATASPPVCTMDPCLGITEACRDNGDGCFVWRFEEDCSVIPMGYCDDTTGTAACVDPCDGVSDCATQGTTCNGSVVESCQPDADGCLVLQTTDCAAMGEICDPGTGTATCRATGTSCMEPIDVPGGTFTRTGADFEQDYPTDSQAIEGAGCEPSSGSGTLNDAVFSVPVNAGDLVIAQNVGGVDLVVNLQSACGDAEACFAGVGAVHLAQNAGDVHSIFSLDWSNPSTTDYDLRVNVHTPTEIGTFAAADAVPDQVGSMLDGWDSAVYAIEFTEDVALDLDVTTTNGDPDFYLWDASGNLVETLTSSGNESLTGRMLPAGRYVMRVLAFSDALPDHTLSFSTTAIMSTCGNGMVEGLEDCEDFNFDAGDGCSPMCQWEGESCADQFTVPSTGLQLQGTWSTVDDDLTVGGSGCNTRSSGQGELVFRIELDARQRVRVSEHNSSLDSVISILDAGQCGPAVACIDSSDGAESTGLEYFARDAQVVYAVVESYSASESDDFDIRIEIEDGEVCNDGVDDDGDGDTDCADSDCFGAVGFCESEAICEDGADNDLDGDVDCYDLDCQLLLQQCQTNCGDGVPEVGEHCDDGNSINGDGCSDTCRLENETCASATVVPKTGLRIQGTTWDVVDDDLVLGGSGCNTRDSGQGEMVFQVDLAAGETVLVREMESSFDGVLSILGGTCDGATACYESQDFSETTGAEYTATSAETVYVVVESYFSSEDDAFDVRVNIVEPEICDDGFDNDADDAVDCSDSDCFGAAGACDVEMLCADGLDNDGDGDVDCADTADCTGQIGCFCGDGFVSGTETCDDGNADDTDGCSNTCQITAESCAPPAVVSSNSYQFAGADWSVVTDDLELTDDTCTGRSGGQGELVFQVDLAAGETVVLRELESSFDGVLSILSGACSGASACHASGDFSESTGQRYTASSAETVYAVVESWSSIEDDAFDIRIDTHPPEDCTNGMDDNADGLVDCEESWCFGKSGCTVETVCGDGADNDADGSYDCGDSDCMGVGGCNCGDGTVGAGESCEDGNTINGDGCDANCQLEAESCSPVSVLTDLRNRISGPDWSPVRDDHTLNGAGCTTRDSGQGELVFQVDLAAGQTVRARESGGLDSVISLLNGTCGDATACLVSSDSAESTGVTHTASADQTVFVVVESYSASTTSSFDIEIDILEPEVCDDGFDNDGDGDVDCDDPNCFGLTGCTTELNCQDGQDNDGDTVPDCNDSDCASNLFCQPVTGFYESFSSTQTFDLVGHTITYTPDGSGGYTWSVTTGATYPVTPGSGSVTQSLALGDSDAEEWLLTQMAGVPFFGTTFPSVFVGSNGFVTFESGDSYSDGSTSAFFDYPRIAGVDDDLDPDGGNDGTIVVDESPSSLAITFTDVPVWATGDLIRFQIVIYDTGQIVIAYEQVPGGSPWVGLSSGGTGSNYPAETDFLP